MMNKKGLNIEAVMEILNCTRSYVYKLVRKNQLEVMDTNPLIVTADSVIAKLGYNFPFLLKCKTSLDYHVKQVGHHV
jgi:succinyl-CoA synthetase beta subunit